MTGLVFRSVSRRLVRGLVGVLASLSLAVLLLLGGVRASGVEINAISTASMTPTLPVNALTFTTTVDPAVVFEGDIVLFTDGRDRTIMHRVVEIIDVNGTRRFRTKGDANQTPDRQLLHEQYLIGRLRGAVPRVGALVELAGSRLGPLYLALFQAPIALRAWLGATVPPGASAPTSLTSTSPSSTSPSTGSLTRKARRRRQRALPRLLTRREQQRLALAPLWLVRQ